MKPRTRSSLISCNRSWCNFVFFALGGWHFALVVQHLFLASCASKCARRIDFNFLRSWAIGILHWLINICFGFVRKQMRASYRLQFLRWAAGILSWLFNICFWLRAQANARVVLTSIFVVASGIVSWLLHIYSFDFGVHMHLVVSIWFDFRFGAVSDGAFSVLFFATSFGGGNNAAAERRQV